MMAHCIFSSATNLLPLRTKSVLLPNLLGLIRYNLRTRSSIALTASPLSLSWSSNNLGLSNTIHNYQKHSVNSQKPYLGSFVAGDKWTTGKCFGEKRPLTINHHGLNTSNYQIVRKFHTTPRRNIPPMIWIFLTPLAKAASIITGRTLRKKWQNLPASEKKSFKEKYGPNRLHIAVGVAVLLVSAVVNYITHLQETPITHRKRYLAFTPQQLSKIIEVELEQQMSDLGQQILPQSHIGYTYVTRITKRIVDANQDMDFFRNQKWTVAVINSPERNAFVLPTGHIFVHLGLLRTVSNDDQLAVVLGHEMAHALLSHAAEQLSFAQVLDVIIIFTMAAIWFFMPTDGIALVTQWFNNKVVKLMLQLPYCRKLEAEADEVGLQLIAKACYDVRESSKFWNTLDLLSQNGNEEEIPEWLSTHPSHENRAETLDALIPKALETRKSCNCPPISQKDPRTELDILKAMVKDMKSQGQPVQVQIVDKPTVG